jgi:hypothetical protein
MKENCPVRYNDDRDKICEVCGAVYHLEDEGSDRGVCFPCFMKRLREGTIFPYMNNEND